MARYAPAVALAGAVAGDGGTSRDDRLRPASRQRVGISRSAGRPRPPDGFSIRPPHMMSRATQRGRPIQCRYPSDRARRAEARTSRGLARPRSPPRGVAVECRRPDPGPRTSRFSDRSTPRPVKATEPSPLFSDGPAPPRSSDPGARTSGRRSPCMSALQCANRPVNCDDPRRLADGELVRDVSPAPMPASAWPSSEARYPRRRRLRTLAPRPH